jgi:GNAT superfamily N-acetyltransferase
MASDVVVTDVRRDMPDVLGLSASTAAAEGFRIVSTVVDHWIEGSQRFDGADEILLAATADGEVVAVGGLKACPHVDGALRVRRFYVTPTSRRRGVASALASELIDHARGTAHLIP